MVFLQIRLIVKQGHYRWSGPAFCSYGMILAGVLKDYSTAYEVGKLATALTDRFNATEHQCRVTYMVNTFIRHRLEHMRESLTRLKEAYYLGTETGDFEFGALSLQQLGQHGFMLGENLSEMETEIVKNNDIIRTMKQHSALLINLTFTQAIHNLRGLSDDPSVLRGEQLTDREIKEITETGHGTARMAIHFLQMILCVLFRRYEAAVKEAAHAQQYLSSIQGSFASTRSVFFDSLAHMGCYSKKPPNIQKQFLARVRRNQKTIKKATESAPMNNKHLYKLVQAECCRVLNQHEKAQEYYETAISMAKTNGYLNDMALALETTANYYLEKGNQRIGRAHLTESLEAYSKWGAVAKANDIVSSYPLLNFQHRASDTSTRKSSVSRGDLNDTYKTSSTNTRSPKTTLDFYSVIKASQSLSSVIVLDELLERLMHVVIENAGAEKGYMIMEKNEDFFIEARIENQSRLAPLDKPLPLEECQAISRSVVRYVIRTGETVLLGDASNEGSFIRDEYIEKMRPKSVFCMPIIHQGNTMGILYLENNHITDAFTADRIEVLRVLCSQAAISIENSRLYSSFQNSTVLLEQTLERAQEGIKIKNEFIKNTSHELRTPLNAIIDFPNGMLGRFERKKSFHCSTCKVTIAHNLANGADAPPECPVCKSRGRVEEISAIVYDGGMEEIQTNIKLIEESGHELSRLVGNILDAGSLDMGDFEVEREEMSLGEGLNPALRQPRRLRKTE